MPVGAQCLSTLRRLSHQALTESLNLQNAYRVMCPFLLDQLAGLFILASQNAVCLCLESPDVSQGGTNRSNLACTDLLMNPDHTVKQVSLIYVTCQNHQLKKSGSE